MENEIFDLIYNMWLHTPFCTVVYHKVYWNYVLKWQDMISLYYSQVMIHLLWYVSNLHPTLTLDLWPQNSSAGLRL